MKPCFVDVESRSPVAISKGTDLYTAAADVIIVTWAFDDARPAAVWDLYDDPLNMPAEFADAITDPTITLVAHNANFDRNAILHSLKMHTTIERWFCTRACAYAHGLPGALDTLGLVLGLSADQAKLTDDKRLIHIFCEPRESGGYWHPSEKPEEWARFLAYAGRDTEALREIYRRLPKSNYKHHA